MEEYRDKFIDLFYEWQKEYKLVKHVHEGWTEISIIVIKMGKPIVSIHEKADRPLRCEPGYEDDHEESMRMREIAYYKAYNSLKSWIDSRKLDLKGKILSFGGNYYV